MSDFWNLAVDKPFNQTFGPSLDPPDSQDMPEVCEDDYSNEEWNSRFIEFMFGDLSDEEDLALFNALDRNGELYKDSRAFIDAERSDDEWTFGDVMGYLWPSERAKEIRYETEIIRAIRTKLAATPLCGRYEEFILGEVCDRESERGWDYVD